MKRIRCSIIICFALLVCALITGCKSVSQFDPITASVLADDQFGDVLLDIQEVDLAYGDSINLTFSGGYSIESVPFYPDFYGNKGDMILTDFYEDLAVAGIRCSFNETANIKIGETLTITLDERGKYRQEYEAYQIDPDITKWEGQTDEDFRNAREISAGNISEGILYRGASPFDEMFGRIEQMDSFIREHNIQCILDLSDKKETLDSLKGLPENTVKMLKSGKVIACPIGIVYTDPETMSAIGSAMNQMIEKEGPYLIQCSLGRDRTGVISALLEALCGAGYDEIIDDYMESYRALHDIDMNPDSLQYRLFRQRIDETLEEALLISQEELSKSDLEAAAVDYFVRCGMPEDQVARLRSILTR